MANSRKSKIITKKEDIDLLINLKEEDITYSFIMEIFGEFGGKKRFETYDTFTVPKGYYGVEGNKNIKPFRTTVGTWIFNKYFVEPYLFNLFGYIDYTITKKSMGGINKKLSYALLEDDIELDVLKDFLMKTQKFMPYVTILSPSFTLKMLTCTKEINREKQKLYKQYKDRLDAGDEVAAEQLENELKRFAKSYLDGDPSMDSYLSGARGSFDNNFKNMFIMKGAMKDPDPNKGYNIAMSNYMDGIAKEEYKLFANSVAAGPYARAKKTELGGHWEKLFVMAFQHLRLDPPNSDCGTKRTLEIILSPSNLDDYIYSYIVEGKQLIELTSKNASKYYGKKIKIRFSSLCESKTGFCNKCAGNLYYRMEQDNMGPATATIPSTLKNLSMKSFHDSTIVTVEFDAMKAFGLK